LKNGTVKECRNNKPPRHGEKAIASPFK